MDVQFVTNTLNIFYQIGEPGFYFNLLGIKLVFHRGIDFFTHFQSKRRLGNVCFKFKHKRRVQQKNRLVRSERQGYNKMLPHSKFDSKLPPRGFVI